VPGPGATLSPRRELAVVSKPFHQNTPGKHHPCIIKGRSKRHGLLRRDIPAPTQRRKTWNHTYKQKPRRPIGVYKNV